jgi:hypothetical protein
MTLRAELTLTWDDAVAALANLIDDETIAMQRAAEFVACLSLDEQKRILVSTLISHARHARRIVTLDAERSAEALGAVRRTTASEWEEWGEARRRTERQRVREREERNTARAEFLKG